MPSETLVGAELTRELGIRGEHDLFGGIVPHAFVATKSITHPLVAPDAYAPAGWSHGFPHRVRDDVLSGFSAFTREDARRAGALSAARELVFQASVHVHGRGSAPKRRGPRGAA
jgi:hypothetical protein